MQILQETYPNILEIGLTAENKKKIQQSRLVNYSESFIQIGETKTYLELEKVMKAMDSLEARKKISHA